jgi:galactokinase
MLMEFPLFFKGLNPVIASAPGRVNLLGEHTDYNDGYMLPIATPQRTEVAVALSDDGLFHFYSANTNEAVELEPSAHIATGFGRYIEGCIRVLEQSGVIVPPLRVYIKSTLVMGAGLSSSAALEVAVLRALRLLLGCTLTDVQLAQLAQQAEVTYAGVNCGIMDQMAASLASSDQMLLLDARTLSTRLLPLPAESEMLVLDSGVPRTLAASKYNARRQECEDAARALRVNALRDITDIASLDGLPELLLRRARHVVSENARVLAACESTDPIRFGQLMNASHASLRDDFDVSIPELDLLTTLLQVQPGVFGARLTGAGFGGACVALCERGKASQISDAVLASYNAAGQRGRLLIPSLFHRETTHA